MKTQREMDSKAGTSKNEIRTQLKKMISKSASSLLIAMAGFGMMSFDLQDERISHADTNVNTNTELAYVDTECCAAETIKPSKTVIGPKKATISFNASKTEVYKADAEHARNFAAEEKERRVWSMNLASSRAKADNEAVFNFRMSTLYPEVNTAADADAQMIRMFGEDLLQQSARLAIANADAEAHNKFREENFSITLQYATADADAGMLKMFEDAIFPYITYPSAAAIASADAEVMSNQEASVKNATIAIK